VTPADVGRDAGRAVDTTTQYLRQSKEEFQKDLEVRLRQMDVEIAKLREQGSDLQADAKVKWEHKMAELETKREAARVKLAELRQSSAAAWKDLQAGAKSAWDEMDRAFREASEEF
jgi:DNA-binding NtrC family response regulator